MLIVRCYRFAVFFLNQLTINYMKKQEARDIAKLLIAVSGNNFDLFAFEDSGLKDNDINKVLNELNEICENEISRIRIKYNIQDLRLASTEDIINAILYE